MREPLSGFNGSLLQLRADAHPRLEEKHVLARVPLDPKHARVQVPHDCGAAEDVRADAAVSTLREPTIGTDLGEPGENEPQIEIEATPPTAQRRLIAGREQDRVRLAIAGTTGYAERRVIDLQSENARLLCVAAK